MATLRNLVELLARLGAHEPTAVLYGACTASTASSPSYGPEADRLKAVVDTLISSLDEEGFGEAKARGETLSGDEPSRSPRQSHGAPEPTQTDVTIDSE